MPKGMVNAQSQWVRAINEHPQLASMYLGSAVMVSDLSIEYIIEWANYYWRLMPNDRKTKKIVAEWLNYACTLNQFSVTGPKSAAPMFVRVGRSKDAIKNLEKVLESYRKFNLREQYVMGVEELINDVKNKKI